MFGGLRAIVGSVMPCKCALAAEHAGCVLADREASRFFAYDSSGRLPDQNPDRVITSSSDRQFDYAPPQHLSGLTDTFHVLPGLRVYDTPPTATA